MFWIRVQHVEHMKSIYTLVGGANTTQRAILSNGELTEEISIANVGRVNPTKYNYDSDTNTDTENAGISRG